ncbi:MAG TPA: porphobilinogen synthase [Candidatus Thermoplasmatota archaeon]|nr:porphobilinogen synthase [Candidatus Thermoplasmatota archaeon]
MPSPIRPRRLRRTAALRRLVQEARLAPAQLVAPLFVEEGLQGERPVPSMPGVARLGVKEAVGRARALEEAGVGAVLLFGVPSRKDPQGSAAWDPAGVTQQAIAAIKADTGLPVIADLCLCASTDHGHCGVLQRGEVANDATVELYGRVAVAQARAGADLVAPSGMMDHQVGAIRAALDAAGFPDRGILAYSTKLASSFYGPFRDAAASKPAAGDRRGHQLDPANAREAVREAVLDVQEGADIVMVKPAGPCLDLVRAVREAVPVPVAAYQVSGEYSMLLAAAERGWLDRNAAVMESLLGIRRAGADLVITYFAEEVARRL